MKKLLSLIALSCAMAMAFGAYAPRAGASVLTADVAALKVEQPGAVQKAYYYYGHRRWHHGYRWRRHHGWRHHYGWRHRYWRHHYGWRHRYWRNRYYGWRHRYWSQYAGDGDSSYQTWRERYYAEHGYYPYRRHYYYNSYTEPTYRRRYAPAYGYCIGLCWW